MLLEPSPDAMPSAAAGTTAAAGPTAAAGTTAGRVDDELVAAQVGPGVVEHVPVPARGQDADQGSDQHAEADRGQGGARAGPVATQVAQGQARRDRRVRA